MNGLFLKDMITFRKTNKITGMVGTAALLVILLIMKNEICFYIANFILLPINAATQPSMLSYYDAQWKWKPYMIAAPVSAHDIVLSRMLSSFVIFAIQIISVELFNVAFLLLNPTFSRKLFAFLVAASIICGAICVVIYIMIDFVLKNNRSLSLAMQLVLFLMGVLLIYVIGQAQFGIFERLLSVSFLAILGGLAVLLLIAVISTYLSCISAVKKRS